MTQAQWYEQLFQWINWYRQTNIGLAYYLKIDPYELEANEWARRVIDLKWFREQQTKSNTHDG